MSAKNRILGIEPEDKKKEETAQNTPSPQTKKPAVSSYDELLQQLYPKPDKNQLEKRAKRARSRNIIAALGDGVSTIANLVATSKGAPNMDTGKNTLSSASQVRYDKLLKNYKDNLEKYRQGRLKGLEMDWKKQQADLAQSNADRAYNFEQSKFDYTKARHGIEDDRYTQEQQHRADRERVQDERDARDFNENVRRFEIQQKNAEEDRKIKERQVDNYTRRYNATARGKKLGFSDGGNNTVNIYENVWKASYPAVFEQLVSEGIGSDGFGSAAYAGKIMKMTPREKMEFVMQNWYKSETARAMMQELSEKDPALDDMEMSDDLTFSFDNDLDW